MSQATLSRRVRELGFRSVYQKRKPFISAINRQKRLEWCLAHQGWTDKEWDRVLWSDESMFYVRYKGLQRVWSRDGEENQPHAMSGTVKHGGKVMIWGSFASCGTGAL